MTHHTARVLLVDDDEASVMNMTGLLRSRGFEVSTALDGLNALKVLEEEEGGVDVVVLEIRIPGIGGMEVLDEIRKKYSETVVIILTSHATVDSGVESVRRGAFDYLMKPCDVDLLTEKIKAACEVRSIRKKPVLWPGNLVKALVFPSFVKLYVNDPIEKALDVFRRDTGGPAKENLYVLETGDGFAGTVNRKTLLDAAGSAHPQRNIQWNDLLENPELLPPVTLGQVMQTGYPITTNPEENLTSVALRMIENNIRAMPVVEDGIVKGFIRLQDIFHYVEQEIR